MSRIEIRRILCPTDFSMFSRRASEYALALAASYAAELVVLHVCDRSTTSEIAYPSSTAIRDADPAEAALRQLSAVVAPARALGLEGKVELREGRPATEIVTMAEELPADLVVMGTHGCAGFRRCALGSVAETVLRRVHCPVLTVPGPAPEQPGAEPLRTIVCATDFSPAAAAATRYAASLAKEAGERLILMHVMNPEKGPELIERSTEPAGRLGFETAARLMLHAAVPARKGFSVDEVVIWGQPAPEILKLAGARDAGMIVIGVHGRKLLDLMALGSVTHQVIREASCPVLTVRLPNRVAN